MKLVVSKTVVEEIREDSFFSDTSDEAVEKLAEILTSFRRITRPRKYSRKTLKGRLQGPLFVSDGMIFASPPEDAQIIEFKR